MLLASGALWAELAPTAIALAVYFCFADFVLISQCLYYNTVNARRRSRNPSTRRRRHRSTESQETEDSEATAVSEATEDEPLLQRDRSGSTGLPGSHRRNSRRQSESNLDPLTRIITGEDETPDSNPWLHNAFSLASVWVVGAVGWFISYKMGAWNAEDGVPADDDLTPAAPTAVIGIVLGYISAVCYLWYASARDRWFLFEAV